MKDIVTISGSFRLKDDMVKIADLLAQKGKLVFLPNFGTLENANGVTPMSEDMLKLHCRKIAMSEALIVAVGEEGYSGESTQAEVDYAYAHNIPVYFSMGPVLSPKFDS